MRQRLHENPDPHQFMIQQITQKCPALSRLISQNHGLFNAALDQMDNFQEGQTPPLSTDDTEFVQEVSPSLFDLTLPVMAVVIACGSWVHPTASHGGIHRLQQRPSSCRKLLV